MAKKFKAILSLDRSPFLSSFKHATETARRLGAQFRANPIKFVGVASFTGVEKSAYATGRAVRGMGGMAFSGMKLLGAGVIAAGAALAAGTYGTLKMGSGLEIFHRQTGFAIGRLSMMKRLLSDNGMEMEQLSAPTAKMSKNLDDAFMQGGAKAAPFQNLGLDVGKLHGQNPIDSFMQIGRAISVLPNQYARASAAAAIFGKSGKDLLAIFADKEGFAKAAGPLSAKAILLEQNAATFHRVSVLLAHSGDGLKSFFVGFTSGIGKDLEAILEKFHASDLSGVGLKFADSMKNAAAWVVSAWNDPRATFAYFWAEGKAQAMEFVNWSDRELRKMFPDSGATFDSWTMNARNFIAILGAGIEGAFIAGKEILLEMTNNPVLSAWGRGMKFGGEVMAASGKALGAIAADLTGGDTKGMDYNQGFSLGGSAPKTAKAKVAEQSTLDNKWKKIAGVQSGHLPLATIVGAAPFPNIEHPTPPGSFLQGQAAVNSLQKTPREGLMGSLLGVPGMMMGLMGTSARGMFAQKTTVPATFEQAGINPLAGAVGAQSAARARLAAPAFAIGPLGGLAGAGFGRGWGTGSSMGRAGVPDSLIGHAERRRMRNERVARGEWAPDIAAGDHRRAKDLAAKRERIEAGKGTEQETAVATMQNTGSLVEIMGKFTGIEGKGAKK